MIDDDEIERRLLNWARCYPAGTGIDLPANRKRAAGMAVSGPMGYGAPLAGHIGSGSDRGRSAVVPLFTVEASETNADIAALDAGQRKVLESHYVGRGPLTERLVPLGIKAAAYYQRLKAAKARLRAVWEARDAARGLHRPSASIFTK